MNGKVTEDTVVEARAALARIDRQLARSERELPQELFAPWLIFTTGLTLGAIIFAAGGMIVAQTIPPEHQQPLGVAARNDTRSKLQ